MLWCPVPLFCPLVVSERRKWITPLFPALRSGPTAASGACRQKQISSSSGFSHEANRRITSPAIPPIRLLTTRLFMISFLLSQSREKRSSICIKLPYRMLALWAEAFHHLSPDFTALNRPILPSYRPSWQRHQGAATRWP